MAGSVQLRTKLLLPSPLPAPPTNPDAHAIGHHHAASGSTDTTSGRPDPSVSFRTDIEKGPDENAKDGDGSPTEIRGGRRPSMAIIRIEIADTGVGLRSQDMVEYVATSIGAVKGMS